MVSYVTIDRFRIEMIPMLSLCFQFKEKTSKYDVRQNLLFVHQVLGFHSHLETRRYKRKSIFYIFACIGNGAITSTLFGLWSNWPLHL